VKHSEERAKAAQNRIADRITNFSGSMAFVYRADAKRQVIADAQWKTVQEEETENQELLELSRQILQLTKEVHALTARDEGNGVKRGGERPSRPVRRARSVAARV
jgi:hypothetical protein